MDSPVPDGVTVHKVGFSLMGVMYPLPSYKVNDWVQYGGMVYKPSESGSTIYHHHYYHHCSGEFSSGGDDTVWGDWGGRVHRAEIWGESGKGYSFYCS